LVGNTVGDVSERIERRDVDIDNLPRRGTAASAGSSALESRLRRPERQVSFLSDR
jgi:hypothetical protein